MLTWPGVKGAWEVILALYILVLMTCCGAKSSMHSSEHVFSGGYPSRYDHNVLGNIVQYQRMILQFHDWSEVYKLHGDESQSRRMEVGTLLQDVNTCAQYIGLTMQAKVAKL